MKTIGSRGSRWALVVGCWLGSSLSIGAQAGPKLSGPQEIMAAVFNRPELDQVQTRVRLTIRDKRDRTRVRVLRSQRALIPGGSKSLQIFESPAEQRNTGLLIFDYDDGDRADDVWLYVRSLRRSTRITQGRKSGAFLGSDFSYADMTTLDPALYELRMVAPDVKVGGESCWVIEARPKNKNIRDETGYLKMRLWVSKSKMMPLQIKAWVIAGKRIKYIKAGDLREVDNIWVAYEMSARTMRNGELESETLIKVLELKAGVTTIVGAELTQARLEQGL